MRITLHTNKKKYYNTYYYNTYYYNTYYYNTGTCIKFAESDPVFNGKIEQLPSIFNDKYYKE